MNKTGLRFIMKARNSEGVVLGEGAETEGGLFIGKPLSVLPPSNKQEKKYFVLHQYFFEIFLSAITEFRLAQYGLGNNKLNTNGTPPERAHVLSKIFKIIAHAALRTRMFHERFGRRLSEFEEDTGHKITCLIEEMTLVAQVMYEKQVFNIKLKHNGNVDQVRECIFTFASYMYRDVVASNMRRLADYWGTYCVYSGLSCGGKSYQDILSTIDKTQQGNN